MSDQGGSAWALGAPSTHQGSSDASRSISMMYSANSDSHSGASDPPRVAAPAVPASSSKPRTLAEMLGTDVDVVLAGASHGAGERTEDVVSYRSSAHKRQTSEDRTPVHLYSKQTLRPNSRESRSLAPTRVPDKPSSRGRQYGPSYGAEEMLSDQLKEHERNKGRTTFVPSGTTQALPTLPTVALQGGGPISPRR
jgi:hypothetical protein